MTGTAIHPAAPRPSGRNHSLAATIPAHGYDLVSEQETNGSLTVEPGGSAVVREVD